MSSETLAKNTLGRKTAWFTVIVTGLVEGSPARFGFYSTLLLRNGTKKRCPMVVQVTDEELLQRLRQEVKPGDEIQVCVETDWATEGIPKFLKDFTVIPTSPANLE